jgi:hypothetical protein
MNSRRGMEIIEVTNVRTKRNLIRKVDAIRKIREMKAFERWRRIGKIVVADLIAHGDFFQTPEGPFVFDQEYSHPLPIFADDAKLGAIVLDRYGVNPQEYGFNQVVEHMKAIAHLKGRKVEIRRVAFWGVKARKLYISRFDGKVYRLDGSNIELVDNGTDDVFFRDDPQWEPFKYAPGRLKGQLDKHLFDSVNFEDWHLSVEDQRQLLKLWTFASFFGSSQPTKIILLLLGVQGAGKSLALRRIQKLIFGSRADLHSVEKDKQDAFIATVTTDPLALFDNMDERIGWLPANLSRVATGVTFPRRQLYTTNTKVNFPAVSWLGITSRTVDFMENQADLPDRTLPLKLGRIADQSRCSEARLLEAISTQRGALMSELLDELNGVVRRLRGRRKVDGHGLRMADFAEFCVRVEGKAKALPLLRRLEQAQAALVFENEPLQRLLELWLAESANQGRSVTAGDLFPELGDIARKNSISWPFSNSTALGKRLAQVQSALRTGMQISTTTHNNQTNYRFSRPPGDGGHGGLGGHISVHDADDENLESLAD